MYFIVARTSDYIPDVPVQGMQWQQHVDQCDMNGRDADPAVYRWCIEDLSAIEVIFIIISSIIIRCCSCSYG